MTGNIDKPGRLLSLQEGAERIGIHPSTLRRHGLSGEIPLVRVFGRVCISEATVEHVVEFGVGSRSRHRKRSTVPAARTQGPEMAAGN
jgi:predicted site-specific integrase-resolvase